MEIVPVIDLKKGIVVHARHGDRANYAPIQTPLSPSAEPDDIVAALMRLAPFRKLYAADLDAIAGIGDHREIIARLAAAYPDLDIWTDRGSASPEDAEVWLDAYRTTLVLGSESQSGSGLIAARRNDPRIVLSLDFRGDAFQGPAELLHNADLWPGRVIVMTLARVGSDRGPDLDRLRTILGQAGRRQVYAAGGLRDVEDGWVLAELGIAGILTASALHNGALTPADIEGLKTKRRL